MYDVGGLTEWGFIVVFPFNFWLLMKTSIDLHIFLPISDTTLEDKTNI